MLNKIEIININFNKSSICLFFYDYITIKKKN